MDQSDSLARVPSIAGILTPPVSQAQREEIGDAIWTGLCVRFQMNLSAHDLEVWKTLPEGSSDLREYIDPEHIRIVRVFDDYILRDGFGVWGWRLLMSRNALKRLAQWEIHSPELLDRLGAALEHKARVFRGEKSEPLRGGIEEFADGAILELQSLLRLQRDEFRRRSGPPPRCERIAEWIVQEVNGRPTDFPHVYPQLGQLRDYLANYLPLHNKRAARLLEAGQIRADSLFYQWFAVTHNRNVKDVQNQLSARRTEARRRSSQK